MTDTGIVIAAMNPSFSLWESLNFGQGNIFVSRCLISGSAAKIASLSSIAAIKTITDIIRSRSK